MTPNTLLAVVRYFSNRQVCHDYMRKLKWPSGTVVCPKCGNDSCKELASRPGVLKCNKASCQKQFSYKVGTIFEDSPLGLDKWFVAVWAIANCKNGISSHELARAIGVTQKTAWHMLHRVRKAMETDSFVGGKATAESWAFSKETGCDRPGEKAQGLWQFRLTHAKAGEGAKRGDGRKIRRNAEAETEGEIVSQVSQCQL